MVKEAFKLAVASVVGVLGMVVAWGCLDAWQISEWVRVHRITYTGTQAASDLSWYAEDRRAVWTVGAMAPPLGDIPDLLLSDRPVVPFMIRKSPELQPAIAAAMLVGTGLLSWLSTSFGALLMRARASKRLDRRLWSSPRAAAALRASNWRFVRYCAMSTGACAAVAWYLRFDRSASSKSIDDYFQISSIDALVAALVLVLSGVAFGAYGWSRDVRSCTSVAERERSRVCARCRYPRAGLADGPCPECGTDFSFHDSSTVRALRARPIVVSGAGVILLGLLVGSMREHQWVSPTSEMGKRFGWKWAVRENLTQPQRWFALRSCYLPSRIQAHVPEGRCAVLEWPQGTLRIRWKRDGQTLMVESSSAVKASAARELPETWQLRRVSFDADTGAWTPATIKLQGCPCSAQVQSATSHDMLLVRLEVPPKYYSLHKSSQRQPGSTGVD